MGVRRGGGVGGVSSGRVRRRPGRGSGSGFGSDEDDEVEEVDDAQGRRGDGRYEQARVGGGREGRGVVVWTFMPPHPIGSNCVCFGHVEDGGTGTCIVSDYCTYLGGDIVFSSQAALLGFDSGSRRVCSILSFAYDSHTYICILPKYIYMLHVALLCCRCC